MSVLLHPVLAYTQVAQVARRSSTASLTNLPTSSRSEGRRIVVGAPPRQLIASSHWLIGHHSGRFGTQFAAALLPSSLCHAGRRRIVRLL